MLGGLHVCLCLILVRFRMAHFHLDNQITEVTKMDAPINRGPLMRWQRKALEESMRSLSVESMHKCLHLVYDNGILASYF